MKLRIQGNSLRLRLNQKEVDRLREGGPVESRIDFAPGQSLVYLLEGSPVAKTMSAAFDGRAIRVAIPMEQMTGWVDSHQVGVEACSQAGLHVLVEKDFQCLHRPAEQEPDAYPHPLIS